MRPTDAGQNLPHPMLSDVVVRAVEEGRFHVWGLSTVDEGIELLTGVQAGDRQADGTYPPGSVHRLVQDRLRSYAACLDALVGPDGRQPSRDTPSAG